ncbi:11840_t:CDS:1, partial [Scutellospora calospora]
MKTCTYFDKDKIKSLDKWKNKIVSTSGCCLFEYSNSEPSINETDTEFLFAFQTKIQKELMSYSRVICLDSTHRMNKYSYHLFTFIIQHPMARSGYPIAFLI